MIDDKRKFIFIENPKTATYSMKVALMGENYFLNPSDPRLATVGHSIPAIIKPKYPQKWKDYLTFVVVRNTWDRAHSFFQFYSKIAKSLSYQALSFDEWVATNCPPPDEAHLRAPMHGEGRFDDVLCQLRYTEEVEETIVLHSFNKQDRVQELQLGMNRICKILKIDTIRIPTDGNNYGRSKQAFNWKRETVERLRSMYSEEIERFGFKDPIEYHF